VERFGIEVVRHAPGVGSAFGDHPQVLVEWRPRRPLPRVAGRWMTAVLNADDAHGSIEVLQSTLPAAVLTSGAPAADDEPLPFFVSVHDPAARSGSLRLASADPAVPPAIDYGYLGTPEARGRMRQAVRLTADIVHAPGFAEVSAGLVGLDDATLRDHDALDDWVHGRLGTSIHLCATAPMGAADDPMAVVDGEGRVHGVAALRVADTSILPNAPIRGPAVSAILVGELIASAMRAGA
jgi:choline dehydrogenase-like flavoprotein